MGATFSQIFPPTPAFTDAHLPDLKGKVIIVTGGYSGIGYELSAILYRAGAKVYIAGRSEEKGRQAISKIEQSSLSHKGGQLEFLHVDLSDLSTIKSSVRTFQLQESKLDILFNNAGVSLPPAGSKSAQGHELQLAVNCFGPYLLTKLLIPQLRAAAASTPASSEIRYSPVTGSTRVVWTSSQVVELAAPKGGIVWSDLTDRPTTDQQRNYTNSKTGNYYLAAEFAKRLGRECGVLSVTTNPGGLKTELLRNTSWLFRTMVSPLLYPPVYGAYTNLYAGFSTDLKLEEHGGAYIVPWGRIHGSMRQDILMALKSEENGGTGQAAIFWDFCDEAVEDFV